MVDVAANNNEDALHKLIQCTPGSTVWIISRRRPAPCEVTFVGLTARPESSYISCVEHCADGAFKASHQFTYQDVGKFVFLNEDDANAYCAEHFFAAKTQYDIKAIEAIKGSPVDYDSFVDYVYTSFGADPQYFVDSADKAESTRAIAAVQFLEWLNSNWATIKTAADLDLVIERLKGVRSENSVNMED